MIGEVFGLLTVEAKAASKGGAAMWLCACECGARTVTAGRRLRSGKTKSCGCLRAVAMRATALKHGNSAHPLYNTWTRMHARCSDPNGVRAHRYRERGIVVCERWNDFTLFAADVAEGYSPELTLDRIDNDGPYSPENCRWATDVEQARNRSTTVLRVEDVEEARRLYLSTSMSQREVGEALGVTREAVKHVLRGLRAQ